MRNEKVVEILETLKTGVECRIVVDTVKTLGTYANDSIKSLLTDIHYDCHTPAEVNTAEGVINEVIGRINAVIENEKRKAYSPKKVLEDTLKELTYIMHECGYNRLVSLKKLYTIIDETSDMALKHILEENKKDIDKLLLENTGGSKLLRVTSILNHTYSDVFDLLIVVEGVMESSKGFKSYCNDKYDLNKSQNEILDKSLRAVEDKVINNKVFGINIVPRTVEDDMVNKNINDILGTHIPKDNFGETKVDMNFRELFSGDVNLNDTIEENKLTTPAITVNGVAFDEFILVDTITLRKIQPMYHTLSGLIFTWRLTVGMQIRLQDGNWSTIIKLLHEGGSPIVVTGIVVNKPKPMDTDSWWLSH